jgi:glycosyltransferase involved in cell wall biosynthesis
MKIIFLERSLGMGGAQRQMLALAIGLKRRGHDIKVALFYREGGFIPQLEAAGIQVHILEKANRWDVARFTYRLRRFVETQAPDVLCTFLEVPNLFSAMLKLTMPRLRVVWGIRSSNMDMALYDRLTALSYRARAWLSRVPDQIVANSEAGKDCAIRRGVSHTRIIVIPNGIDTERFRFDALARARIRQEWQVADDEVLVGLIARLDPMKGHDHFIQAAAQFADRPKVRFVCVGEPGPFSVADVKAMAAVRDLNSPKFIVAGKRDDIAAVMSALDIACSTSTSGEGFSNSIAEAMACGTPCVVTDVGDARLIVGDAGFIITAGDVGALTEHLGILSNDKELRARVGAAGRRRIQSFSVARMVARFEEVFYRQTCEKMAASRFGAL